MRRLSRDDGVTRDRVTFYNPAAMDTLSRREESDLLEKGKKEAMKHCEDIVKGKLDPPQWKMFR
jgi:hypothetical protein